MRTPSSCGSKEPEPTRKTVAPSPPSLYRRSTATFGHGATTHHNAMAGHSATSPARSLLKLDRSLSAEMSVSSRPSQHTFGCRSTSCTSQCPQAAKASDSPGGLPRSTTNFLADLSTDAPSLLEPSRPTSLTAPDAQGSSSKDSIKLKTTHFSAQLDASLSGRQLLSGPGHLAAALGLSSSPSSSPARPVQPQPVGQQSFELNSPVKLDRGSRSLDLPANNGGGSTGSDFSPPLAPRSVRSSCTDSGGRREKRARTSVKLKRIGTKKRRRAGMLITNSMLDPSAAGGAALPRSTPTPPSPVRAERTSTEVDAIAKQREHWLQRHEALLMLSTDDAPPDLRDVTYDALDTSQLDAHLHHQQAKSTTAPTPTASTPAKQGAKFRLRRKPPPLDLTDAAFLQQLERPQLQQQPECEREAHRQAVHFVALSSPALPEGRKDRRSSAYSTASHPLPPLPPSTSSSSRDFVTAPNSARSVLAILDQQQKQMEAFSQRVLRTPYPFLAPPSSSQGSSAAGDDAMPSSASFSSFGRSTRSAMTDVQQQASADERSWGSSIGLPTSRSETFDCTQTQIQVSSKRRLPHSSTMQRPGRAIRLPECPVSAPAAGSTEMEFVWSPLPVMKNMPPGSSPRITDPSSDVDLSTTAKIDALLQKLRFAGS